MSSNAFSAGDLTNLRKYRQSHRLYLAVHKPATVASSTLASVPTWPADGMGAATLTTADAMSGGIAGQTVRLSRSGAVTGYLRLRLDSDGSTSVRIAATSENALDLQVGDTVEILNEFRPWPKRLRYDISASSWKMDYDVDYTDQTLKHGPIARLGAPYCAIYKDSYSAALSGANSKTYTPSETEIIDYSFYSPAGLIYSGASPSATYAGDANYNNGNYITLTVTDKAGKTHTTRRLIFTWSESGTQPYSDFIVENLRGTWGGGWRGSVRVRGNAATADFPDGTAIVIFYSGQWDTTTTTIGGNAADRSNILFSGYIVAGTVTQDTYDGAVTFEIATIDHIMQQMGAFPMTFTYDATPANWLECAALTLDIGAVQWLKWRTTVADVCDVYLPNNAGSTAAKPTLDLDESSLWEQLVQNYSWLPGGTVSVDCQGAIWCEQDAIVTESVASLPNLWTLDTATDVTGQIVIDENTYAPAGPAAQVILYGITSNYTTTSPISTRAPDDPIDYGLSRFEIPAGLLFTQSQANAWAAGMRAKFNNAYPSAVFPLYGFWPLDPTPQSFITASLTSFNVKRPPAGVTRYVIREIEHRIDASNDMIMTTAYTEPQPAGVAAGVTQTLITQAQISNNAMARQTIPGLFFGFDAGAEGWVDAGLHGFTTWSAVGGRTSAGCMLIELTLGAEPFRLQRAKYNNTAITRIIGPSETATAWIYIEPALMGTWPPTNSFILFTITYTDNTFDQYTFPDTANAWIQGTVNLTAGKTALSATVSVTLEQPDTGTINIYVDDVFLPGGFVP